MIVKTFEIEKINRTDSNFHLIYGNNEGIKEDLIRDNYLKSFTGEVLKYDEQEILSSRDQFIQSLHTKSLFGSNKVIIISRGSDKITNLVAEILESKLIETKIIIKSSNLEKRSKLRNLFEKEKNCIRPIRKKMI